VVGSEVGSMVKVEGVRVKGVRVKGVRAKLY
jgi:hypothetical protein